MVETQRHFVDGINVNGSDHRIFWQTAEESNLGLEFVAQGDFGATNQDVRLNAIGPQFPH